MGRFLLPFSRLDERDIRALSKVYFGGGRVPVQFQKANLKWRMLFEVFLVSVNRENGSFHMSPLEAMVAPAKTMSVLRLMQSLYVDHIHKKIEEIRKK